MMGEISEPTCGLPAHPSTCPIYKGAAARGYSRATNARGASGWREGRFTTKQLAVGGGGVGVGYTWTQTREEVRRSRPVPPGLSDFLLTFF